ncbi:MAG: fibronectin type III domain-containing protein [Paludibacter sp.]
MMKKITLLFTILLFAFTINVSAQTQLATPTVGTATLPTTVGFTANWTSVSNAFSYIVNVYNSTPALVVSVPVAGATTATTVITGLSQGTAYNYTVIAVGDTTTFTNSAESTPSAVITTLIQLTTPTVGTASRMTLTGFTANWTGEANATSYSINVYDGANSLVAGSPKTVTGATSALLAISAILTPNTTYTYTVTAIGDGLTYASSVASANSASFTTATSTGTFTMQYADTETTLLNSDLKGGAADIYELTTSGGAYTFNTGASTNNNTLVRNTTIKAAAGLASKPILKINSTTTSGTCNIIYTATPGLTIKLTGLEFNGINAGGSGQPIAFYSTTAATNTNLYISNCYFHDMLNVSGNGTIRMDGVSTTQVMDIQGSIFNKCGGRILYNNSASGTTNINIKNCTFSNNALAASRASVVYNTAANVGTQTYDHCTFYNILVDKTSPIYIKGLGGAIAIKNSLFSTVALTQPLTFGTTITDCYVGGFATPPTGTTTPITTTPIYTNAATLDFSLTNKSLFTATTDALIAGNTIYYAALPKLDSPTVGVATLIGTNGFTANWTTVTNASGGYSVKVYEGGITLVNTTPVAGQTSTSAAITGLKTGTSYTYTVTAVGDAINYDNSNSSTASTSFYTLGLPTPIVGTATDITANGFTANWTPTANAIGYDVMVYLTSNLVTTTKVNGQTASSVILTGLAMGTTYTYKVIAVGDSVSYTNSDPSASSAVAKTLALTVSALNPNFSDGTWGLVATASPALGSYPVFSANGWDLTHAIVKTNTTSGPKGEAHPDVLMLDKTTNSGVIVTPVVASVAEIEIHSSATAGRQYYIQSTIDAGTTWLPVGPGNTGTAGTYYNNSANLEQIDIIPTGALTNVQFKITDPSSGAFTFYHIISRTTLTTTLATPTVGAASAITATTFTANWTPVDANAKNYEVKVYKGTTLKVTAKTIGGQATSSLVISGLQPDSTYTYKVKALGDGDVNYLDSYISAASAPFTMGKQLATPIVGIASNVTLTTFTANWTAIVPNAINYEVKVYKGTSIILTATTKEGQNSISLNIGGLLADSTYMYTVKALGDTIYANSNESAASAPFTMAHKLVTPSIPTGAAISTTEIKVNWSVVLHASAGYMIKTYQDTSLVDSITVNDSTATNAIINGLKYATKYTFTVTALGNNTTYFDSNESEKSNIVITDGTGLSNTQRDISLIVSGKEIRSSETGNIEVFNLQGAKLLDAKVVSKLLVHLDSGLYIVRLTVLDGKEITTKMIIK